MVAERRFLTGASDRSVAGTLGAMGQIVCFPGWDALRAMTAEEVKTFILSQEECHDKQYVSVVTTEAATHRGPGSAQPVHSRAPQEQVRSVIGESQGDMSELATRDVKIPPPYPGLAAAEAPVCRADVPVHDDEELAAVSACSSSP